MLPSSYRRAAAALGDSLRVRPQKLGMMSQPPGLANGAPGGVIVTGGAGFIGSRVVDLLTEQGESVTVVDRSAGRDVRDAQMWRRLKRHRAVIHLAGILGTEELFADPFKAVEVNVEGTVTVLEACREKGMSYVGITMPEVWPNLYQATKTCARQFATAYNRQYGIGVSHVRAFNAYGPGQKHGEGHPQKIIPTFATRAWQNLPIPIWGDGNQTVDLIHVDDIARMLVEATTYTSDECFDAGTSTFMTVNDVARFVIEVTGSTGGVEHLPLRGGELPNTHIAATAEGWDLIGWSPTLDLERLRETVLSYRDYTEKTQPAMNGRRRRQPNAIALEGSRRWRFSRQAPSEETA